MSINVRIFYVRPYVYLQLTVQAGYSLSIVNFKTSDMITKTSIPLHYASELRSIFMGNGLYKLTAFVLILYFSY